MTQVQLERILDWLVHNFVQVLLIFSIFIQITPVKWNPVSSFVQWVGKLLTHDLNEKLKNVENSVEEIKTDIGKFQHLQIHVEMV